MPINSVQMTNVYSNFGQVLPSVKKKEANPPKGVPADTEKPKYTKKQMYTALLAATAGSAVVVGAIMHGRGSSVARKLENKLGKLENEVSRLEDETVNLNTEKNSLIRNCDELSAENTQLREDLRLAIDSAYSPDEYKLIEELRNKINSEKPGYDVNFSNAENVIGIDKTYLFKYPSEHKSTTNRSFIEKREVPEISEEGRFDYELPMSSEVKITKAQTKDFEPIQKSQTNMSEEYAESIQWDNDKLSRDILQNFFDGHGQTLDGVKIKFDPVGDNGVYKVRIEGKSTYTPDKALFLGETTKRNNASAAGNYGEGIKVASIKLLRDKGAKEVKIGSDNWELKYSLEKTPLLDKRVFTYSLDKQPPIDGNYLEFETNDKDLLKKLRLTIDRFYSSSNTHFKCPDFENEVFGVKKLQKGEKGGLYISGQRFEFENQYDGLEGVAIFIKQKPPVNILDPSRDRTSINVFQLKEIAKWLSKDCTNREDKLKFLKAFEKYGENYGSGSKKPMNEFINNFVFWADCGNKSVSMVEFPEKYVAYTEGCSADVLSDFKNSGYKIFNENYSNIGMKTIGDVVKGARNHTSKEPSEKEIKRILILKEAIKFLEPALKKNHFSKEEIDTKIYIFDRLSKDETDFYKHAAAEAIIENYTSKGFWIDREYLNSRSFTDVLETALHELSHKAGGDETAAFSYKLTDVNRAVINQIVENSKTKTELKALSKLWGEV